MYPCIEKQNIITSLHLTELTEYIITEGVINMKVFEIIRTKDLESFYILAENPLDAIRIHKQNLDKIQKDKQAMFFDTGNSYVLKYDNDVYCLVYKYKNRE
jgi:hypothetical protein